MILIISAALVRHSVFQQPANSQPLLSKQLFQRRASLLRSVLRLFGVSVQAHFEVVAKICALFIADFFGDGFAALLRDSDVIEPAEFADMQCSVTRLAFVEAAEGEAQRRERRAALPTDGRIRHGLPLDIADRVDSG